MIKQKKLNDETRKRYIKELKETLKKIEKELKESPCYYRGCELWYDCEKCDGFKDGCSARLPEIIFKNKNGTWRKDVY